MKRKKIRKSATEVKAPDEKQKATEAVPVSSNSLALDSIPRTLEKPKGGLGDSATKTAAPCARLSAAPGGCPDRQVWMPCR